MGSEEMTRSGRKNWEKHTILYGIFVSVGIVGVSVMLVRCKCDAYPRGSPVRIWLKSSKNKSDMRDGGDVSAMGAMPARWVRCRSESYDVVSDILSDIISEIN